MRIPVAVVAAVISIALSPMAADAAGLPQGGVVSTVVGYGAGGELCSPDGVGLSTSFAAHAVLAGPAVDSAGRVYWFDGPCNLVQGGSITSRLRRYDPGSGSVTTVAGTGSTAQLPGTALGPPCSPDGVAAADTYFLPSAPVRDLTVSANGDVVWLEAGDCPSSKGSGGRLRVLHVDTGLVDTIAGQGPAVPILNGRGENTGFVACSPDDVGGASTYFLTQVNTVVGIVATPAGSVVWLETACNQPGNNGRLRQLTLVVTPPPVVPETAFPAMFMLAAAVIMFTTRRRRGRHRIHPPGLVAGAR